MMNAGIISFTDVDSGIDLANALEAIGVRVTLYLSRRHLAVYAGRSVDLDGFLFERRLLCRGVSLELVNLRRMRDLRSFQVMRELQNRIVAHQHDVVHIFMGGGEVWTAALANMLRDLPVVASMIIPEPNLAEFPPAWAVAGVNWLLAHGSQMVIVNGRAFLETVPRRYRIEKNRVVYQPVGPRSVFKRWQTGDVPEDAHSVLFFGRMNHHKGLADFIEAQPRVRAAVPDACFIIAGHGPELERLRSEIAVKPGFDVVLGFVRGDRAATLFQRAAVIALPYLSAASSGVLMTAYLFKKPVVATRVGCLAEYVEHEGTGLLIPPASPFELADALIRLLQDNSRRQLMGQRGFEWMQAECSWPALAEDTCRIYQRACNLHAGRVQK